MTDQSLAHGPYLGWFDMANIIPFYRQNRSGGSAMLLTTRYSLKSLFVRPITDNLRICRALQTCLAQFTLLDTVRTWYAPPNQ